MQRQNQYARDEHEQAWKDAYGNAPPFQQKWGVGVKVQPQRRSACTAQYRKSGRAHCSSVSTNPVWLHAATVLAVALPTWPGSSQWVSAGEMRDSGSTPRHHMA